MSRALLDGKMNSIRVYFKILDKITSLTKIIGG